MGDISLGAVGAAIIAGLISLFGLILSKEQKTSEFRQAWIDSLRSELVTYATKLNSMSDAYQATWTDTAKMREHLNSISSDLNIANFNISLRLNSNEKNSQDILKCMKQYEELASNPNNMTADKIRPIELEFLISSKKLLKKEWERVKHGELAFRISKVVLIAFIIFTPIAWYVVENDPGFRATHLKSQSGKQSEKTTGMSVNVCNSCTF